MLVARYAGKDEMAVKLRDAVRAHQNNAEALQLSLATAKILERVVLGCTIVVSFQDHFSVSLHFHAQPLHVGEGRPSILTKPPEVGINIFLLSLRSPLKIHPNFRTKF